MDLVNVVVRVVVKNCVNGMNRGIMFVRVVRLVVEFVIFLLFIWSVCVSLFWIVILKKSFFVMVLVVMMKGNCYGDMFMKKFMSFLFLILWIVCVGFYDFMILFLRMNSKIIMGGMVYLKLVVIIWGESLNLF